ncbi:ATP-binding cassette domain-containing protein [Streptomyces sp. SID3343]|uniref:ATP-binding cassette domain-containing protein n=1 Tax=Streptomyces sp. SID3343 TaxID=2690260 RepID=UPI00136D761B|nr:ATP-binding cassette domain-containing protein [Streptomyces sp. SID3343]MYW05150.1 ATP-binding cassette domain-containing protein [Streptomyces sp. SID3343]
MRRNDFRLLPEAARFLGRRKRVLVTLGGWSLVESAQTFLGGYGVAMALDRGFLAGRTAVGLLWLAVAAVAVVAGGVATGGVFRGLADLVEPLRDGLVRRVVAQALAQARAEPTKAADSAAVSRLTNQTEIARDSFAGLVLVARSFVFTAVGALVGLAALAPLLLVVVVPPLVIGLLLFLATLGPMAARQRDFLSADEALATQVGAIAEGLRDVVACGAQEAVAARTHALIEDEARTARSLARWAGARCVALGVAGQLPVVLLLIAAPWLLREGLTAGALVGAFTYLTQALLPALHTLMNALGAAGTRLLVVLDRLTAGTASVESAGASGAAKAGAVEAGAVEVGAVEVGAAEVGAAEVGTGRAVPVGKAATDLLREPKPPAAPASSEPPFEATGVRVEARGLTFAYGPGAQPVLRELDLTVEPGEHMVVVGPSGIGKSTLVALVAGLLVPDRGDVFVAGKPARGAAAVGTAAVGTAPLRVLIPQQAYVFTGTVRENLEYLCPCGADAAAAEASADAVGLTPLVRRLGGFDARIEPATLSQGERQLVALARAHLSAAPLVLLDEATCHLDPAAEARAELAFAHGPGTLLVVAHRISSARRADRILVLDGVHAVCGSHHELLDHSTLYRDLVGRWEHTRQM